MRKMLIMAIILITIQACKEESKEPMNDLPPIASVFNDFYEDGLKLNPIGATFEGDDQYNDTLPNFLSESYENEVKRHYTHYKSMVNDYEDANLTENERMTKAILNWESDINLAGLTFGNFTPVDQMWSLNLLIGQLASGASAQPFATVKDYNNWLSRLEDYSEWLKSAKKKMQEGMEKGNVLPKSLIKKVIPQLASVVSPALEDNLFYSPIQNFPDSFTDAEKSQLTEAYSNMITEKIVPGYKSLHDFMNRVVSKVSLTARTTTPIKSSYIRPRI